MLPINGVLFIFSLITGGLAEMLIIIFYINMGALLIGSLFFQIVARHRIRNYMKLKSISIKEFNELEGVKKRKVIGTLGLSDYWEQSRF